MTDDPIRHEDEPRRHGGLRGAIDELLGRGEPAPGDTGHAERPAADESRIGDPGAGYGTTAAGGGGRREPVRGGDPAAAGGDPAAAGGAGSIDAPREREQPGPRTIDVVGERTDPAGGPAPDRVSGRGDDLGATAVDGPAAASATGRAGAPGFAGASPPSGAAPAGGVGPRSAGRDEQGRERLVPAQRATEYGARWDAVKGSFVDEPRRAVHDADTLVSELLDELHRLFDQQRRGLEQGLDAEATTTEDLRLALGRYRSFFERLLSI